MTAHVALAMIVLNGEATLADCLRSARPYVDEILVGIDTRTTDQTYDVAHHLGAQVHDITWSDSFAAARNAVLMWAWQPGWVLSLDADERLTEYGAAVLDMVKAGTPPDVDGFAFVIQNRGLDGRVISQPEKPPVRLFRNDPRIRWYNRVHEEVRIDGDPTGGRWMLLNEDVGVVHLGYDESVISGKDQRNCHLLRLQLADNPSDGQAWAYLAKQHLTMGRRAEAKSCAYHALAAVALNSRPDLVEEMRAIARGKVA